MTHLIKFALDARRLLGKPSMTKMMKMKNVSTAAFATAVFLLLNARSTLAQVPVSPLSVSKTEVITFAPPLPEGRRVDGSCWTHSIAVPRPGAYRCSVGNAINDPCFAVPPNPDVLVCGANPAMKTAGFALKLTKSLPADVPAAPQSPHPWLMRLADGSICEAMTGTMAAVNGNPAPWACAIHIRDQIRPTGVITKITPGKVWTAERYSESAVAGAMRAMRDAVGERVPIKTIWQ